MRTVRHVLATVLFLSIGWLPPVAALDCGFRTATDRDVSFARKLIWQARMNPLSISSDYLLVAHPSDQTEKVIGFGQIRPLSADGSIDEANTSFFELASVFVVPRFRRKGVASSLIRALLDRHTQDVTPAADSDGNERSVVCLLTLRPTAPLYERHGFREERDIAKLPRTLQLEYAAGSVVSKFMGNDIICMVREDLDQ